MSVSCLFPLLPFLGIGAGAPPSFSPYERISILASATAEKGEPLVPAKLEMDEVEPFFRKKGYREIGKDGTRRLMLVSPDLYDPDAMRDALALRKLMARVLPKGKLIDLAKDPEAARIVQTALGNRYGWDVGASLVAVQTMNMVDLEVDGKTIPLGSGTTVSAEERAKMAERAAKPRTDLPRNGWAGSWFPPKLTDLHFRSYTRKPSLHQRNEGFFLVCDKLQEIYAKYDAELTAADLALSRAAATAGLEDFSPNALVPGKNAIDLPEPERTKLKEQLRGHFASDAETEAAFGKAKVAGGKRWIELMVYRQPSKDDRTGMPNGGAILIPR